jgi:hypothetical protein
MDFKIVSRHILLYFLSFDGHKSIMHYRLNVLDCFALIIYVQLKEYYTVC